nr:phosphoribosyltransferase family protein [Candidatus Sigynarchaeum springense]
MPEEIAFLDLEKGRGARSRASEPRQRWYMDIETVIGACQSIASEIQKRGMAIDLLYPASRDAFIPVRLLAMYLCGPRVSSRIPEHAGTGSCIIVDDASYTGKTLQAIAQRFKERGLAFGTACVVMGEDTEFEPDFHAIACSSGSRIVFPWHRDFVNVA